MAATRLGTYVYAIRLGTPEKRAYRGRGQHGEKLYYYKLGRKYL